MIQQFGESLESRWYREHSIKVHRQHLKDISLRSKSTIRSQDQVKIVNLRKLSQEIDKQREIERENFLLFIRLNTIKERKISPRDSYGPKSLNLSVRKKEAERIMNENYGYVKRFIEMPSFVSAKRQVKDYQAQQTYKKTISKANLHKRLVKLSSFVAKPGILPPLDINVGRSENHSKLEEEYSEKVNVKVLVSDPSTNKFQTLNEIENENKYKSLNVEETQILNGVVDSGNEYESEHFEEEVKEVIEPISEKNDAVSKEILNKPEIEEESNLLPEINEENNKST